MILFVTLSYSIYFLLTAQLMHLQVQGIAIQPIKKGKIFCHFFHLCTCNFSKLPARSQQKNHNSAKWVTTFILLGYIS